MNDVSALHPYIVRYITIKQALGRGFQREQSVLMSLDQFLVRQSEHDLDARNFARWCHGKQHLASGVLRNHMRIARNLYLYRQRTEPGCFVPDKRLFPSNHPPIQPHIFSNNQIGRDPDFRVMRRPLGPMNLLVFSIGSIFLLSSSSEAGVWPLRFLCTKKCMDPSVVDSRHGE